MRSDARAGIIANLVSMRIALKHMAIDMFLMVSVSDNPCH